MTRADHGHLTTYSRRIVDLFENPTPKKKISSQKKIRKRGLENEFSFWEGLPVYRCYVSFWERTKKYTLVHLKKNIEEQFHLKYFLGNKISSKLPETGFPRFRVFFLQSSRSHFSRTMFQRTWSGWMQNLQNCCQIDLWMIHWSSVADVSKGLGWFGLVKWCFFVRENRFDDDMI